MIHTLLEEDRADYRNLFIGRVVVNDDSQAEDGKKLQRIKVIIPGLYDTPSPWAFPKQPSLFGIGQGYGTFGVPALNSHVLIELQDGDPHYPLYIGSVRLDGTQFTEMLTNYPRRYGFKDPAGNYFYIDLTSGQVEVLFRHKSGTQFRITDSGEVIIQTANNMSVNVSGTLTIASTGNMTLSAPRIDLNP